MSNRQSIFESLGGIDEGAADFAEFVLQRHPEWRSYARLSEDWRPGSLEFAIPHESDASVEPLRVYATDDDCLIIYGPGHEHPYLDPRFLPGSAEDRDKFECALQIIEDVLAERRVVVSVFDPGRDQHTRQFEGAPEDIARMLSHEIGNRYEVWSWLGSHNREGIVEG